MGNMGILLIRSALLSFMMGMSCQLFFETVVPMREMRHEWVRHTAVFAFTAGFMVIAVSEIPPYVLQPVRVILAVAVIAQLYFQMSVMKNLILSVVFCGLYWIASVFFFAVASAAPMMQYSAAADVLEPVLDAGYLCLMMLFRSRYHGRIHGRQNIRWGGFGLLSLAGIIVSMALTAELAPTAEEAGEYAARVAAVAGVVVIYAVGFYYMASVMDKEAKMQKLRLQQERTQNQMELYRSMKERYEQLRRYEHDYRNQLRCIQGLIEDGQIREAAAYIAGLTGNLQQNAMCVNTGHGVVNVLLNQKYQEAREKGAAITMTANDLSGLTLSEEDIVTLLGNLLDNAIEACGRLEGNRVIQFKMILEEEQLVLSVRNPVSGPVKIRNNRIATSKRDKASHGIGLLNVDSVIRKNKGTSVLRCEDGWFSFSAVLPMPGP